MPTAHPKRFLACHSPAAWQRAFSSEKGLLFRYLTCKHLLALTHSRLSFEVHDLRRITSDNYGRCSSCCRGDGCNRLRCFRACKTAAREGLHSPGDGQVPPQREQGAAPAEAWEGASRTAHPSRSRPVAGMCLKRSEDTNIISDTVSEPFALQEGSFDAIVAGTTYLFHTA